MSPLSKSLSLALWLLALLASGVVSAAEDDWQTLITAARQARAEQKLPEAERLAKLALAAADALPPEAQAAAKGDAWNLIGLARLESENLPDATQAFQEAATLYEAAGPPGREKLSVSRLNQGIALSQQKKFKEAAEAFRQRLTILEELFGEEAIGLVGEFDRLSRALTSDQQYAEARAVLGKAQAILTKAHGPRSEPVATVLDRLAELWEQEKNYVESERLYRESLAIRREIHADSAHEDVFNSLFRLGDNRRLAGDLPAAQALFAESDKKIVQRHCADATERAGILKLRRDLAKELKDAPLQAECEQALERLEKIEVWRQELASIDMGRTPEKLAAADPRLTASLAAARDFGDESLPVYVALLSRGRWHQFQGQFAEALSTFDETLKVAKVVYGDHHPETAAIHFLRGIALEQLGRMDDAQSAYLLAVESNEKSGFAVPTTELAVVLRLATISSNSKRPAEALGWYSRYRTLRGKTGKQPDAEWGQHLNEMGVCHAALEQWAEALACFNEALPILETRLLADAPLLATVRGNLAFVRSKALPPLPPTSVAPTAEQPPPLVVAPLAVAPVGIPAEEPADTSPGTAAKEMTDLGVKVLIALVTGLVISYHAWRRGYFPLTWLAAFLATCTTPIITACLLATLPDRRVHYRREKQRRWLARQLQPASPAPANVAVPALPVQSGSLGDEQTRA